ncbi:hypothetical protein U1Q18_024802 [Sarracenia purpurea var. burkii]
MVLARSPYAGFPQDICRFPSFFHSMVLVFCSWGMRSNRWCGQCCCGKWVAGFWKLSCSSFLGAGGAPYEVTMVVSLIALLLQVVQASQVKWYLAIPGCSSYHFVVWP